MLKQVSVKGDSFIIGNGIRQHYSRAEVESMLEKREKDSHERGFKEGYSKGVADGEAKARDESRARIEEKIRCMGDIISQLSNARNRILTDAQQDILKLSMVVAAKIIHREAKETEAIKSNVLEAIKLATDRHSIKIRLNPEDVEMIESSREDFLAEVKGLKSIEILEDEEIIRGGCIIETPDGSVDARTDRQMEEIRKILMGA